MPSMAIQSKGVLIIMPSLYTEDTYEQAIIELFENMGYDHLYAPDMDRDYSSPLLDAELRNSLVRINRGLPVEAIDEALSKLNDFDTGSLLQKNIIFTIAVENEVADNMYQRSELDYLIYNDPIGYADLILNGDPETYLKTVTEYKPLDS